MAFADEALQSVKRLFATLQKGRSWDRLAAPGARRPGNAYPGGATPLECIVEAEALDYLMP